MKTIILKNCIYLGLTLLATSFVIKPEVYPTAKATAPETKVFCGPSIGISIPSGLSITISGVRIRQGSTTHNFTAIGGYYELSTTYSGNWLVEVQVTGAFGSLIHEDNINSNDYMAYPNSDNTPRWFVVWDGTFPMNNCSSKKIYFCANGTGSGCW